MTLQELIAKFNGEQVGDRVIAVVDGKREYVANIVTGGYALTYHGEKLVQAAPQAEEAPKPKRKKKSEDAELDDLLNGVEE